VPSVKREIALWNNSGDLFCLSRSLVSERLRGDFFLSFRMRREINAKVRRGSVFGRWWRVWLWLWGVVGVWCWGRRVCRREGSRREGKT
jgi:hypothetical protein